METDIYVVQSGDTIGVIAAKFGISVAELTCLNGISPLEKLIVGQSILLPHFLKNIESLGYFHLEDLEGLMKTLTQTGQFFTYGGVFQFPVTTEGSFSVPEGVDIDGFVYLLKTFGIIPLIVITNWGSTTTKFEPELARAVIRNDTAKGRLINELLALLQRYGFCGVNINFEDIYPDDREYFLDFVRDVKLALENGGYLVTITVPAKASDIPEDPRTGGYDYKALGELADFTLILTYDWGWIGSPPMAVAPINEVEKVIAYAVTQIHPVKILQGIPLYGYDWHLPYVEGTFASAVNLVEVYGIARRYQAMINYDPLAQTPFFRYRDNQSKEHVIWFEDSRSLKVKYEIARNYNLGGVGFWSNANTPYGFQQNWVIFCEMFLVLKGAILL